MRARFVDVDGVRTRFLHAGEGPAVFLLHGVGVSSDTFIRNVDALGERFTVIAPDLLGHGFTDAVDFASEPPQHRIARHISRLADELGFEHYSVGGSSFGALIAALMWFERPERVKNLLLIGSGSTFHPANEQEKTLRAAFANGAKAMADPTLESCGQRMAAICYGGKNLSEDILLTQLTSYALPDRLAAYKATIEGVIASLSTPEHRVYSRLEQIEARSLILTGREDVRSQWAFHVEGRKRMPKARLLIFEQCGHLPYLEHPAAFNAAVGAFLSGEEVGQ
jgi:2-hydroxy-6-oxonona-2,4-dienedioate hydrolase